MFDKPKSGSVIIHIGDCSYRLNNMVDIANSWLEQTIYGLDTDNPFSVKAYSDSGRMVFTVSFNRVHIYEDADFNDDEVDVKYHKSIKMSRNWFCEYLYYDIKNNIDDWVNWFGNSYNIDLEERKRFMQKRLIQLRDRIRREYYYNFDWDENEVEDDD